MTRRVGSSWSTGITVSSSRGSRPGACITPGVARHRPRRASSASRSAARARVAASVLASSSRSSRRRSSRRRPRAGASSARRSLDALAHVIAALAGLHEPRVDLRELALRFARGAFGLAQCTLGRLARSSLGEVVPVRRWRVGHTGQAAADGIRHVDRVEAARFERADQPRRHDGRGGRGIHHRRVDRLLDVGARRRADRHAPVLGQIDGLARERRDERPALATRGGRVRRRRGRPALRGSAPASSSASASWPSRASRSTAHAAAVGLRSAFTCAASGRSDAAARALRAAVKSSGGSA